MTAAVSLATLGNGPAFRAYMANAQTISGNTFTKLNFNAETFDTNNCFDITNYRFTPTVAGYYQVNVFTYFSITGQVYAYKNGNADIVGMYLNSTGHVATGLIYLNGTTDYIEAYFYCNPGVTTSNNSSAQFSAALVRGA